MDLKVFFNGLQWTHYTQSIGFNDKQMVYKLIQRIKFTFKNIQVIHHVHSIF